jgi:hypothetical protein
MFIFSCFKDKFPKWIDLRSNGGCPNILDDSILNISAISSVTNCIRYLLKHNNQKDYKISRLYLYYYIKNIQDGNIDIKTTLNFIKENEICSEDDYPYDVNNIDIKPVVTDMRKFYINYIPIANKVKHIKYSLNNNRPVLLQIYIYNNTDLLKKNPNGKNSKMIIFNTAIYGYRSSNKCFICMHSKGKEWGEKGFFYLPYQYVKKYSINLFAITNIYLI